jgi:hypothetical protein
VRDLEADRQLRERGIRDREAFILTFDKLLSGSTFPVTMQKMLKKLEATYQYPVDVEFTANYTGKGGFQINLVQCRPLQTKGEGKRVAIPKRLEAHHILFQSKGNFMGGNIVQPIKRIIYVDPEGYIKLSLSEKYDIARLIGRLNRQIRDRETTPTLLMGPGRWGTTTPSLGVPVRFSEINNLSIIVEIEYEGGSLVPELSFGTHFFQDLVETDIFYVALFPGKGDVQFNREWLDGSENMLSSLLPEAAKYQSVLRVEHVDEKRLYLMADILSQRVICFSSSKVDL